MKFHQQYWIWVTQTTNLKYGTWMLISQKEDQLRSGIVLQLDWHPVAVVQYTFTHKQYTEQHNETEYPEGNIHKIMNT